MAWTTPRTWVPGELVTASMMNTQIRDNQSFLYSNISSWTPTITFDTPGNLNVVYATQIGTWARGGGYVFARMVIVTSTFTFTTASGGLRIGGLPLPNSNAQECAGGGLLWSGITKAGYTHMTPMVAGASSSAYINGSGSGQAVATISAADTPSGGTLRLNGTFIYPV